MVFGGPANQQVGVRLQGTGHGGHSDEKTTIIVESYNEGPDGAKGIGEANTVTVPAVVGNLIADATGVCVDSLSIKPGKYSRKSNRILGR